MITLSSERTTNRKGAVVPHGPRDLSCSITEEEEEAEEAEEELQFSSKRKFTCADERNHQTFSSKRVRGANDGALVKMILVITLKFNVIIPILSWR